MASTYSDLKIELIGTGEQVGTWGATTNTNLGTAIEEAIVGSADVSFSSADVTLTLTNTNATQSARHLRLTLTGTSGGARNLVLGSGCQIDKPYIINNGLADTVTVKNTTGTGVAVPAGKSMWVYNDGTNVVEAMTHAGSLSVGTLTLTSPLPVSTGGTGASTLTSNNVILGNGTSAVQFVAPGTNGNILTSNGTTWTSAAADSTIVKGPASATDNAITRFDGTTGKLIQNSSATLDDNGAPTFVGAVNISGTSSAGSNIKLYEDTDNGTNYVAFKAPDTIASDVTWTLPNADGTADQALITNGSGALSWGTFGAGITLDTPVVISGNPTNIDFTGIPSYVKRITVMISGVSPSITSSYANPLTVQLGTSGGFVTSGYSSVSAGGGANSNIVSYSVTQGFSYTNLMYSNYVYNGVIVITYLGSNIWTHMAICNSPTNPSSHFCSGTVTVSGTVTQVRLTSALGTQQYTGGTVNISYE